MKPQTDDVSTEYFHAAGNGLLNRRRFIGAAVQTTAAAALPVAALAETPTEPWMRTPGAPFRNYGTPSSFESSVIRWISAPADIPQNGISWTPLQDLEGTLTPSGLHFERHHNGVPQIDPTNHLLAIHGLVDRPLQFTRATLVRYPKITRILTIECGGNSNAGWNPTPIQTPVGYFHGLVSCSEWTGVPLRLLLDEAGAKDTATWAIAEGADAFGMTLSLPLSKLRDDCFIGLFQNGEALRPEQGYPMRLIVPGWEGVTHVKWLRSLQLTDRPVMARNETARYTELQPDGRARLFTFVMDVKSLISQPSHGLRLDEHGVYEISGLAWSGRGKIARVDVSADGGATWANAELAGPILPQAFTRFRIPWQWKGQPAILQSRATDETGYQQPARASLVAARGRHGYFHYNAIVSWAVDRTGAVRHVYPDAEAPPVTPTDGMDAPWE